MKTWEYRFLDSMDIEEGGFLAVKSREAIEAYLNAVGADGWEIINLDFVEIEGRTSFVGVAKREIDGD
jgi:hypothetical protein